MAKTDSSRIDSLEAILAEKRKHEGYLEKLEARRGSTPEHVFNRLRDEYLTKLTDLQVRASMEAEAIGDALKADETALAELDARLAAVTEERIEGELRAEVGEFDPKDWAKRLESLNASIKQLEKERATKADAYARMKSMLAEARGSAALTAAEVEAAAAAPAAPEAAPASPAAPAAPVAPRPSAPTPARPPAAAPAAEAPAPAPAPAPRATPHGVPAAAQAPAAPAASAPPEPPAQPAAEPPAAPATKQTPAAGAPMAGGPSFDELAFLNSVVGRASTPVKAEPGAPPAPADPRASGSVKAAPPPPPRPSVPAAPPVDADEPVSALGRPTPRTSQAVKTLKCQECGTLNYPTEWYCERCGGELAAL